MSVRATILIADDDPNIRQVVRFALELAGFAVVEARDGAEALALYSEHGPDLVVLDITMPEMDGTEVCRRLRAQTSVPVVFLSSRDDEIDRVVGLELGGDDYVTKPFSPRELVARIKAVLRRVQPAESAAVEAVATPVTSASRLVKHGNLELDLDRYMASWEQTPVELTHREFELLRALLGYPGKVYSRDELMDRAYEPGVIVSDRTIDSHIRRLRRKFEDVGASPVETVHGIGYKLGSCR
ncbi:MAG: response regulator transcription factor [Bradymonadaceae bacterium]|nr:response regulator transcription factor [Lujinxingiaceae bacterium]